MLALMLKRWHVDDRAQLCYRALFRTWNDAGDRRVVMDMVELQGGIFQRMREEIRHERDLEIAAHLRTCVFTAEVADTMRLCCGFSWRLVRWIRDTWAYDWTARDKTGALKKEPRMLAPDSRVALPEPFPIRLMRTYEDSLVKQTGGNTSHADGCGAEINDVDSTLLRLLEDAGSSRGGGMAIRSAALGGQLVTLPRLSLF